MKRALLNFLLFWFLSAPTALLAHGPSRPPHEGPWWLAWNWDQPVVVTNLTILTFFYIAGLSRLWSRAGAGKTISYRQAISFAAGMGCLFLALVSPIDVYSDELSWMHMIQHMMLMGVAAPLLVAGSPFLVMLWSMPLKWRRGIGTLKRRLESWRPARYLLWQPVLMWTIFAFTLWIWHVPRFYEATLSDELFHDFQHFSFVAVSCLFWRVLLDPVSRLRLGRGVGVLYLFLTSLHATFLGVFMTISPQVWYPFYESRAPRWNLTALEDQQIAGLIMWMPACFVYASVAALLLGWWVREEEWEAGSARRWRYRNGSRDGEMPPL